MKKALAIATSLVLLASLALAVTSLKYTTVITAPTGNSFLSGVTFGKIVFDSAVTVKAISLATANGSPFPTCPNPQGDAFGPQISFVDANNTLLTVSAEAVGGMYTNRVPMTGVTFPAGDTIKAVFVGSGGGVCPNTPFAVNATLEYAQ